MILTLAEVQALATVQAPASAGDALTGTYSAFKTYTRHMLAFALTARSPAPASIPIVIASPGPEGPSLPPGGAERRAGGGNPPEPATAPSAVTPTPHVTESAVPLSLSPRGAPPQAGRRGGPPEPAIAHALPLVAYGHPVRAWVESEFGVALSVLSLGSITLDGGQAVPVLGANHPSFIWYAAQQPNARPLAMKVMKQDLIAACWQAAMTRATALDPTAALAWCTAKWDARPRDLCVLTETQTFNAPVAQAKKACSAAAMKRLLAAPEISDEEAARIDRQSALGR